MALRAVNNLRSCRQSGTLCTAMGIRIVTDAQIVDIAADAGYHNLFIEHSTLSIKDASRLCLAGMHIGITPFVRVPYQCGDGFVQRVLNGGAMGVIFPHIHSKEEACAAALISKYPPTGKRSMAGQLPLFGLRSTPQDRIMADTNTSGSTVFLMIETREGVENVDEIASTEGVDVVLIGSNDLAIELGVPAQFDSGLFRSALTKVSQACRNCGKIMGLAGIYDQPAFHDWAVNKLNVGFLLGGQDSAFIAKKAKETLLAIPTKKP